MKTSFFGMIVASFVAFLSACIVMVALVCSCFGLPMKKASPCVIYLVVNQAANVEAVQASLLLHGGAGCLLPTGEVAIAAYFSEGDAMSVLSRLKAEYPSVGASIYAFPEERNCVALYQSLRCVAELIERLQCGMSQMAAKSVLKDLSSWFLYFAKTMQGDQRETIVCLGKELKSLSDGVVLVGELRSLLCETIVCCAQEEKKLFLSE